MLDVEGFFYAYRTEWGWQEASGRKKRFFSWRNKQNLAALPTRRIAAGQYLRPTHAGFIDDRRGTVTSRGSCAGSSPSVAGCAAPRAG